MLYLAHNLIVGIYLAAPIVALAMDFRRAWRKGAAAPSAALLMTISAAILVGTGIAMLYVLAVGGKARIGQILLAVYFATGLLLILKVFDYAMRAGLEWLIRRKVAIADNPTSQLGYPFEDVSFRTSDGLRISGWWIPAIEPSRRSRRAGDFGQKTVVVCHGLGASK